MLGLWRPHLLFDLLRWLQRIANRLANWVKHSRLVDEKWAAKTAAEFTGAALAIANHPGRTARTLFIAFIENVINLASLYMLFLAFYKPVELGVLIAGFAIGILFRIVSIPPQGIGVVEGVTALVFILLGVPAERATVVALTFRGLSFWLPLLLGFFLLHKHKVFSVEHRIFEIKMECASCIDFDCTHRAGKFIVVCYAGSVQPSRIG